MTKPTLTVERLKEVMQYDPETGKFCRLITTNHRAKAGDEPGWNHCQGYRAIAIDGRCYLAHRLAWFFMTGEWPVEVDHRNRNRLDNRWENLRNVTHQQNAQNVAVEKDFKLTTKLAGVSWDKSTSNWKSSICVDGRQKHLGRFDTDAAAHAAYVAAKRQLHAGNLL